MIASYRLKQHQLGSCGGEASCSLCVQEADDLAAVTRKVDKYARLVALGFALGVLAFIVYATR